MDDQNKNLLLAMGLSLLVIVTWTVFFAPPPEPLPPSNSTAAEAPAAPAQEGAVPLPATPAEERAEALADTPRIAIDTELLAGSISLVGGRIDDLALERYKTELGGSGNVTVLSPVGSPNATYALFGWSSAGGISAEALPGPETLWAQAGTGTLTPATPVTLTWDNGAGLAFERTIAIDEDYMFTITEKVTNTGTEAAELYAFGVVERQGLPPDLMNFFILHEGVVQMSDGTLQELDYADISDLPQIAAEGGPAELTEVAANGWIGFTEHYWQTVLVPVPGSPFTAVSKYLPQIDLYRTSVRQPAMSVAPGQSAETATMLFAGPKEWEAIRAYQNEKGIQGFIDSIDWGWFYFLTKPIFAVLHWLNAQIGNMGLAIIGLTFIMKALLFPLSRKSYISMARMKELQPEMEKLKERTGGDRQRFQQEMIALYKREKVNPAAGCLPILLQIPIFFSLYKVIFVTIELRHAPFFGWIRDLSAPDPSSIYNLFGLLPWEAPATGSFLALIFIGILPLLLGVSMWLQQKLNPAPTDATQAAIFAWMPWIFMFMLAPFASGLIVYWIANNLITFAQQYLIMWSHGARPDLFGNIRSSFQKKPAPAAEKPQKSDKP
jgi:YidC/Oxa1 family membrane protein insertase